MSEPLGTVSELWLFPVKSMRGVRVPRAHAGTGGFAGDRAWAVLDAATGRTVTAREAPQLRDVQPVLDGDDLRLAVPGTEGELAGAAADAALSAMLGRAVRLAAAEGGGSYADVAPVHLVSRESIDESAAGHVHAEGAEGEDCPCSVEAPRANVVLTLAGGLSEREAVGDTVAAGQAVLRLSKTPRHCLGVYAEVLTPGVISEGDALPRR